MQVPRGTDLLWYSCPERQVGQGGRKEGKVVALLFVTSHSMGDTVNAMPTTAANAARRGRPPHLRWLQDLSRLPSSRSTPSSSTPSLPSSSESSPPPDLALLTDALREPLIRRPPRAHIRRHSPWFSSLTRSTLPTSSLSFPSDPPSISTQFTSPRSSIDTLRSISSLSGSPTRTLSVSSTSYSWQFFAADPNPITGFHRKYRSPKNPVVFCHGLLGFDSVTIGPAIAPVQVSHWRGITEVLEANGTQVLITRVPATSSPADRAKVLEQKISQVYPGRSIHLIGHSMGGLDCRYLTTHLTDRTFSVLSITTIATPHRGSSFADHFLATIGPDRMSSVLSFLEFLPNGGGNGKAFEALTLDSMRKFNEETPDVEGVRYFSWGAMYEPGLIDTWK